MKDIKLKKRGPGISTFAEEAYKKHKERFPIEYIRELAAAGCGDELDVIQKWNAKRTK